MNKKILVVVAAFAFLFGLVFSGSSFAADPGPADMVLKTTKGKKPANFPHKLHQESFKCGDCHHGQTADGKKVDYIDGQEIGRCASCHNPDMANLKLNSYKNAGHANCKGCHKDMIKGPTKCNDCHPKKKKQMEGC
ncbi:MAG: cytochrome c3 family protein [Desulfobulbaceae bacterium]|nr:cytochrome c3 family protein [Desulfobulbaceae bacterium]MCK5341707.1 cytochrome c3 family protein [Desulfobulbaceae bacterium]MCK5404674.1 cytochrome c3 family protein [Desulfobulbaceae bacterium]